LLFFRKVLNKSSKTSINSRDVPAALPPNFKKLVPIFLKVAAEVLTLSNTLKV
jgi:hypothetical protein